MTKNTQPKIDLYKEHKNEYAAPKKPVLIEVKPALYLAIEGRGEPGGEQFQTNIGALYGAAFTIKMTRKFAGPAGLRRLQAGRPMVERLGARTFQRRQRTSGGGTC